MWEWETRGIFQSWQGQGACVGREQLDKEKRKTETPQEEKLELLEVSTLPVFQRVQDHSGGVVGRSTHITLLSAAQPLLQACTSHGKHSLLPKFPKSQTGFIRREFLLRD